MQPHLLPSRDNCFPISVVGDGAVKILFLHGWIADQQLLAPMIAALDPARFQAAAFDAAGYGLRRHEIAGHDYIAMAVDAIRVADTLGWFRFVVVGHSMGALAAQYLAVIKPERVSGMVLLAPVPPKGAQLLPERREVLRQATVDPEARRALIAANTSGRMGQDRVEDILRLSLGSVAAPVMQDYMTSWSERGFADRLEFRDIPAAVIMGGLDPGAHPQKFAEFYQSWLPRARLQVWQDCGHYLMWEDPAGAAAVLAGLVGPVMAAR